MLVDKFIADIGIEIDIDIGTADDFQANFLEYSFRLVSEIIRLIYLIILKCPRGFYT